MARDTHPPAVHRQAVVLSGGGANGAYEVGVLKALAAGRSEGSGKVPIDPGVLCGTSIGAFNAAFLAAHWDDRGTATVADLERVWLEQLAEHNLRSGGYRIRANPLDVLNPAWYVPNPVRPVVDLARDGAFLTWDAIQRTVGVLTGRDEPIEQRLIELFDLATFITRDPWLRTIRDSIPFANLRGCSRKLRVAATNWANGTLRVFENHELTERRGPEVLMASSALPGIFEPTMVGAEPFVDGGILMNTPLRPAIDAGAEVIHLVYLDPDVARIPFSVLRNTVGAAYRMQTIAWAKVVNNDLEDAEAINRAIEMILGVGRGRDVSEDELSDIFQAGRKLARSIERVGGHVENLKLLEVHRYHPADEFPGGPLGLLNLNPDRIRELIEHGFNDAISHDCEVARCVIPGGCGRTSDPVEELAELRRRRAAERPAGEPPAGGRPAPTSAGGPPPIRESDA